MPHLPVIAERLLNLLAILAMSEAICPTNAELADLVGCTDVHIKKNLATLVRENLVQVISSKRSRSIRVGEFGTKPRMRAGSAAPPPAKVADAPARITRRCCLKCRKPFESDGRNNHVCEPCKGTTEWQAGIA